MDLKAAFKSEGQGGFRYYSVFDADEIRGDEPNGPVEQAEMVIWPGATGGWGFTATGQEFGDVVSEHELVESGQQNYATVESALEYGLAELTAYYMSDPDGEW